MKPIKVQSLVEREKFASCKVIDFLEVFRDRYGIEPAIASQDNYLANELFRRDFVLIDRRDPVVNLFGPNVLKVDELIEELLVAADSSVSYQREEVKDNVVLLDDYRKQTQQPLREQRQVLYQTSHLMQPNYTMPRSCGRLPGYSGNYSSLESRLGGSMYYARGRGVCYKR